jgi:hypothetical protein
MPSNSTKYAVDVLLNPEDFPSADKSVIWDTSSGSFALGDAPGGSTIVVGDSEGTLPKGTDQFFVTSQVNNDSQTTISGSDTFVFRSIASADGNIRSVEVIAQEGDDQDDGRYFVTTIPHRTQAPKDATGTVLDPNQTNYTFPRTTPVASAVEHLIVTRSGALNVGQKSSFITISLPISYKGSGSFQIDNESSISGSFNYLRLEHIATDGPNTRTQECTHHFSWYRNSSGNAEALRATSIENVRSPINEVVIDPSRTTGSFDSSGNFVLSIYHFNVDSAQHIFKYLLI